MSCLCKAIFGTYTLKMPYLPLFAFPILYTIPIISRQDAPLVYLQLAYSIAYSLINDETSVQLLTFPNMYMLAIFCLGN